MGRPRQPIVLRVGQRYLRRRDVLLEMRHGRRPGNRQHCGRVLQQPCQRDLKRRRIVRCRNFGQRVAPNIPRIERKVWNERQVVLFAIPQHRFALAIADVVTVLHASDIDYLSGARHLIAIDVGKADAPNLAGVAQLAQRADLFFEWDRRITACSW